MQSATVRFVESVPFTGVVNPRKSHPQIMPFCEPLASMAVMGTTGSVWGLLGHTVVLAAGLWLAVVSFLLGDSRTARNLFALPIAAYFTQRARRLGMGRVDPSACAPAAFLLGDGRLDERLPCDQFLHRECVAWQEYPEGVAEEIGGCRGR